MSKQRLICALLVGAVLATAAAVAAGGSEWVIEVVDSPGIDEDTALAIDSLGQPHIGYYDMAASDLKYAWFDGEAWVIRIVEGAGSFGSFNSMEMVLDSQDRPHFSYYDEAAQNLKYATLGPQGDFIIQTVDAAGRCGYHSHIALGPGETPHIAYAADSQLRYARRASDGGWSTEVVDANSPTGWDPSIAVDSAGGPIIAYASYPGGCYSLKLARGGLGGWSIETVDASASVGTLSSIVVDAGDYPHLTYYDITHLDVKYGYQDEAGWHLESIDGPGWVGENNSLALDAEGRAHVAYFDHTHEDLKYACGGRGAWEIEVVDSPGVVGWYASLALSAAGNPRVSYVDRTLAAVKYAWIPGDPPPPTPTSAPTAEPTPDPTPTPPPANLVELDLVMPQEYYLPGDLCWLTAHTLSLDGLPVPGRLYVVLDVYGQFYFWPSWVPFFPFFHYDYMPVQVVDEWREIIPEFVWPFVPIAADGIRFIGAVSHPSCDSLVSNVDVVTFGFGF